MLKQRVITACVLLAVLAAVLLLLPYAGFAVFATLVFVLAAWEWANLAGLAQPKARFAYAGVFAVLFAVLAAAGLPQHTGLVVVVLSLSLAGWLAALVAVMRYPAVKTWHRPAVLMVVGLWLLVPPWLGLLVLQPAAPRSGLIWLAIAVIAAADIGAYFAGRRFGRHKLAVHVSPGKTWEGFWGGAAANAVLASVIGIILGLPWPAFAGFVLAMVLTAAVSVLGDLFESMVKRERGIKDSSQLLPGHGGVLDRVDGWTAAVPVFTLLYLLCGR